MCLVPLFSARSASCSSLRVLGAQKCRSTFDGQFASEERDTRSRELIDCAAVLLTAPLDCQTFLVLELDQLSEHFMRAIVNQTVAVPIR